MIYDVIKIIKKILINVLTSLIQLIKILIILTSKHND